MHDVSASRKRAAIKDHKPICKDLVSQFLHSAQHAATRRVHRYLHTSWALMVTKQMCKTAQVAVLMCSWYKLRLSTDQLRYSEKQHKEMKARFENRMYKQLTLKFSWCPSWWWYLHWTATSPFRVLFHLTIQEPKTLLLHRAFRRITSIINQQLHLNKFHIKTSKNT